MREKKMSTGIGIECQCCHRQLNYDDGFDATTKLCNTCRKETIPMVLAYLREKEEG
jgi:hypothetical protein